MGEMSERRWVKLILEDEIERAGSLRALARRLGVSAAYLSDVRLRKRSAGKAILDPLGWRKIRRVTTVITMARKRPSWTKRRNYERTVLKPTARLIAAIERKA